MIELIWEESPLEKHHDRKAFDCGDDNLNDYLKRYARQTTKAAARNVLWRPRAKRRRIYLDITL